MDKKQMVNIVPAIKGCSSKQSSIVKVDNRMLTEQLQQKVTDSTARVEQRLKQWATLYKRNQDRLDVAQTALREIRDCQDDDQPHVALPFFMSEKSGSHCYQIAVIALKKLNGEEDDDVWDTS